MAKYQFFREIRTEMEEHFSVGTSDFWKWGLESLQDRQEFSVENEEYTLD